MPKIVKNMQTPITTRLLTQEIEAVDQLWAANPALANSRADMVRLLVRQGIRAVNDQNRLSVAAPEVTYDGYARRAEVFMEGLSDLVAKIERYDEIKAVRLANHIADAASAYADDLSARH